jgi:hypothetical protein
MSYLSYSGKGGLRSSNDPSNKITPFLVIFFKYWEYFEQLDLTYILR